jgi:hypothetical protein
MDVPNYTTWQYNMAEARVLKNIDVNSIIIRSVTDAPWPVTDREMIVQFTSIEDKAFNAMTFKIQTVPFNHPKKDNVVRIPFSDAKWTVTQDANKNLNVLYTLSIDPGGTLPAWLVNMAIAEGPFESFSKLKNQLAEKASKK